MNGFIAIPVDQRTKLFGMACSVTCPSGERVVYTTWAGWTEETLEKGVRRGAEWLRVGQTVQK